MKYKNLKYTYNVVGFALIIFLTLRESLSLVLMHTPLQKNSPHAFYYSLGRADENNVPVLLFHGVPDIVHEWVDTAPEFFEKCMKYLYENNYRVISMKQCLEENGFVE